MIWKFQLKFEVIYYTNLTLNNLAYIIYARLLRVKFAEFSQLKYFCCYRNIGPHIHFQIGMVRSETFFDKKITRRSVLKELRLSTKGI